MSVCRYSSLIATLLVTSITLAPATKAGLLIDETDGNFSSNWVAPTQVQTGATGISGAGAPEWMGGDRLDIFHFSGLTPGASSMVFEFSLTGPINPNAYSNGGGSIYYSYVPFSGTYYVDLGGGNVQGSHNLLAGNFDVTYNPWEAANGRNRGNSTFTLNLSEQF